MGNSPMVSPVTGPFTTTGSRSGHGPGTYAWTKTMYKQAKPYNLALAYTFNCRRNLATNYGAVSPDNGAASSGNWKTGGAKYYSAVSPETYDARFRAMEKFRGKVAERAEWLVNLAERNQAINMITSRAGQLLQLSRAIWRLDFKKASSLIGAPRGFVPKAKSASGAWLEYHFGWEPMIKDVYTGIDIIQQPIRDSPVYGVGHSVIDEIHSAEDSISRTYVTHNLKIVSRVGALCECDNPNLWLANRLGLVNPASVAWEMVPFSFVVDWFVPVGAFLNSYTEFLGLKVSNQYTSTLSKELIDYSIFLKSGQTLHTAVNHSVSMNRTLSLPAASLRPPSFRTLSLTRAATAISLLFQRL